MKKSKKKDSDAEYGGSHSVNFSSILEVSPHLKLRGVDNWMVRGEEDNCHLSVLCC